AGARGDVLLVLLSRRAQVDVGIDERRQQVLPGRLYDLGLGIRRKRPRRADLRYSACANAHVRGPIELRTRIERVHVAQQHIRVLERRPDERRLHYRNRLAHAGCPSAIEIPLGSAARVRACACEGALAPASSSYSTAMRTTTPASTCAVITACGESTTSPASSTPRLTGPGCISS